MKKMLAFTLAASLCIGSLTGCGQKSGDTGAQQTTASGGGGTTQAGSGQTAAGKTEASGEQVTIEYWQYFFESKVNLIDELIAEFEAENPNIKVVHQNFPYDNYEQKLAASMAVGSGGPNIINIFYGWVPKYVKSGVLQELPTDAFDPAVIDNEFSPMVQVNKIDGKYYTIPTAVRTSALFYNKDLLEAAGKTVADIPTELDEFAKVAGELAQWDGDEVLVEGCTWQPSGQYHSWLRPVLMTQFGGTPLSEDFRTAQWDTPECQAAFDYFISLTQDYKVGVKDFMTSDTSAFSAGKAVFHVDGSYRVGTYKEQITDFEWGVAPLPCKDGMEGSCGTFWTNGITASTTGPQLEASIKFLQFLTSEEVMKRWTVDVGEIGARSSICNDAELTKDPIMKPFIDALPYATSYFYVSESDDRQILLDAIDNVILQGMDSKTALAEANQRVQALLDEYWKDK